jgi:hypothetical protein
MNEIAVTFAGLLLLALILFAVCRDAKHFKGIDAQLDQTWYGALFQRLYFITTTVTTIGYGDISPASVRAKVVVLLIIFTVLVTILRAMSNFARFFQDNIINASKNKILNLLGTRVKKEDDQT